MQESRQSAGNWHVKKQSNILIKNKENSK
jgi:hypothetical protein